MKAYLEFLEKTPGNDTPEWQNTITDIKTLLRSMERYETPNQKGEYPTISQEEYRRINVAFDNSVKSTNEYIKANANNNNIDDDLRIQSIKNFNKEFLSKAYVEYKNVKPNPKKSLHESMENFRYENVELSNEELNRLGGNLSSRIQMTIDLDGKKTKGVFTINTYYHPKEQCKDLIGEMKQKYPMYNSFWDSMNNDAFMEEDFLSFDPNLYMNSTTAEVYDTNPEKRDQAMENAYQLANMPQYPNIRNEFNRFRNEPDFYSAMFDFTIKAGKLAVSTGVNNDLLGLKPGQGIDNRNSAMSSVANMLGVDNLIAKSKTINVKMPDGTNQKGTFMEFVDSKDITHLDSVDEMRVAGLDAYDNKEVKTQLANLQVLDYICGNVDRHSGNMLYRFDHNTHKLASIKGIDNDASFSNQKLGKQEGLGQLPSIKQMRVIDEKMAQKVLSIDQSMLEATLHGYGLNEEEISASWDRLENLQKGIREAKVFDPNKGLEPFNRDGEGYGLTIVKSGDWDKLKLTELATDNNYFAKIKNAQHVITTENMVNFNMKQNMEVSKRATKAMLNPNNTSDLLRRAKNHKPFMGTSRRYSNVLTAFENYQNTPVPDDPSSDAAQAKWESALALKQAVDAYNQEKKDIGHFDEKGNMARQFKGNALHRIEDVKEIGQFVDRLFESKQNMMDSKNTVEVANRKQNELNEFKNKSKEEQQAILDRKHEEEMENKQDLAVRIQKSLADDDLFEIKEESVEEDLSIDDLDNNLNNSLNNN